MNTNKIIAGAVILIIIAIAAYFIWMQNSASSSLEQQTPVTSGTPAPGTPFLDSESSANGKLNINVVCEGALAYMTFPDGAAAEKFVAECKAGEHPEVVEKYKADMNLGDGTAI